MNGLLSLEPDDNSGDYFSFVHNCYNQSNYDEQNLKPTRPLTSEEKKRLAEIAKKMGTAPKNENENGLTVEDKILLAWYAEKIREEYESGIQL